MKISLTVVGKTTDRHFIAGIDEYVQRISHYVPFSIDVIPELKGTKNLSEKEQKNSELSKKIDAVGSMGQIESAARSELMYRKPEEVSFEVENPELLDSYTEEEWKLLMAEMDNQ